MHRKLFAAAAVLAVAVAAPPAGHAGGALETIDITALEPSPIAGHLLARVIGIRWDSRCIPVRYAVNNTMDPVDNPLGAPFLTLTDASAAFERSFESWNGIRTSFIDLRLGGTVANAGQRGFDMVNEITFRTAANFGAIAFSPSTSLIQDSTFVDGDDIDGDGDADVSDDISTCQDVDGDGDIEFPAGFYKAGTILDNDVAFNTKATNGFRFTVADADIDTVTRSVDLETVAVHEFGHSFGLSHSFTNQISASDGTSDTMFPFIDTGDPAAELGGRTPATDDVAWASFFYPEGTAHSGPAALQHGDIPFRLRYGVITGELRHGVLDQPIAGGHLFAVDLLRRSVVSGAFSGTTRLSFNPATGGLFFLPTVADSIVDGNYSIPVPLGLYSVGTQALDGQPAAAGNISFTAQIGNFFGQMNFNDEFYNMRDADLERHPGFGKPILVIPGLTRRGIDIVTNRTINVNNFGTRDFVGFTGVLQGHYYAVQIPASQFDSASGGDPKVLIHSALFDTFVADASVVPRFAEATLTTGVVNADGTASLDLARPLARARGFIGRDNDFAPFFFHSPTALGRQVRKGIDRGDIQNLFIVLRLPTEAPFPGVSALPPFIGLDGGVATNDVPIFGQSYQSTDGVTFTQVPNFNFRFSLVLSERPGH